MCHRDKVVFIVRDWIRRSLAINYLLIKSANLGVKSERADVLPGFACLGYPFTYHEKYNK